MRQAEPALVLAAIMAAAVAQAANSLQGSVAIIDKLSGEVNVRMPDRPKNRNVAYRWEWLPAGASIEVGPQSGAIVILLNGRRFELQAGSVVTVTADSLTGVQGSVGTLPPLPPIPRAAPIAGKPPEIAAAGPIRGAAIEHLCPRESGAVLAGSAKLSFDALTHASAYRIIIAGSEGELLDTRTMSTEFAIQAGTLKPGKPYSWFVEAYDARGVVIGRGVASFVTLSPKDMEQRDAFIKAIPNFADSASALSLLAALDFRLGLLREARSGFAAALQLKPDSMEIRRQRDSVQAILDAH